MAGKIGMTRYPIALREQVVKERLECGTTMRILMEKYNIPDKKPIKNWMTWYRLYGVPQQITNKGHKARDETLEQKVKRLEMENALLKKFHELLREEHKRK